MGNLVKRRRERVGAAGEMKTAVNHAQLPPLQPKQAVTVSVGETGCFKPEATLQHGGCCRLTRPCRTEHDQPKAEGAMAPYAFGN